MDVRGEIANHGRTISQYVGGRIIEKVKRKGVQETEDSKSTPISQNEYRQEADLKTKKMPQEETGQREGTVETGRCCCRARCKKKGEKE
jgi:hypothetical protein